MSCFLGRRTSKLSGDLVRDKKARGFPWGGLGSSRLNGGGGTSQGSRVFFYTPSGGMIFESGSDFKEQFSEGLVGKKGEFLKKRGCVQGHRAKGKDGTHK